VKIVLKPRYTWCYFTTLQVKDTAEKLAEFLAKRRR